MKKDKLVKYMTLFMVWLGFTLIFGTGVMAQETASGIVGVEYRGHVQDYGDRPEGDAWVSGDANWGPPARVSALKALGSN
ncbi:MAG: hypothetical protein L6276_05260 [Acetobacterium sp.]|nr:hypothetical protein [Acetobacterium sp.]